MQFSFELPTKICFGPDAVKNNAARLALGKRAFIVTGRQSGRASGALADVQAALASQGVAFETFEGVGNNPNVTECKALGEKARACGADFIVGIGGGSPLDAAKAIAVFACNDIPEPRIFQYGYDNGVLPIAAVPTTSGTGSEVTPWSIMTDDSVRTKRSFGGPLTFPRVALLDPRYTEKLSQEITFQTGMDAFQHCFESYLSMRATPMTDALNLHAMRVFASCMQPLAAGELDGIRGELMLVSLLGGVSIAQTGTTLMHAMGYPLTYFYGVPHGKANCIVLPAYLAALSEHRPERLREALGALGLDAAALAAYVKTHFPAGINPSEEELRLFAAQTVGKNPLATTGVPNDEEYIYRLYRQIF